MKEINQKTFKNFSFILESTESGVTINYTFTSICGCKDDKIHVKYNQSNLVDFSFNLGSTGSKTAHDSLVTSTDGYEGKERFISTDQSNKFYQYKHRQGYLKRAHPFNEWWIQKEPDDSSRANIKKAYRLGAGF